MDVTITAPAAPTGGQYGGYIVLTDSTTGPTYRIPYAGFIGDYQSIQVLTPTVFGFPQLAKLSAEGFYLQPVGASYTMVSDDIPFFLVHLDHPSRRLRIEAFDAVTGKAWHLVSSDDYLPRISDPSGFFYWSWDGITTNGKKTDVVPNGQYVVRMTLTKALGEGSNPAHTETWTSPEITIARP